MVADLAVLHEDDIAAILDVLEAKQRTLIETLLKEHAGHPDTGAARPADRLQYDPARLSPWLVERIEGPERAMTAQARRALRECAAEQFPIAAKAAKSPRESVVRLVPAEPERMAAE